MEIPSPVDSPKNMGKESLYIVDVEIRIVAVRSDEQVLGERAGSEAEKCIRQCQDFLRLTRSVGFVALAADR